MSEQGAAVVGGARRRIAEPTVLQVAGVIGLDLALLGGATASSGLPTGHSHVAFLVAPAFVAVAAARGLYRPTRLAHLRQELRLGAEVWAVVLLALIAVLFFLGSDGSARGAVLALGAAGLVGLIPQRIIAALALHRAIHAGRFATRRVALITDGSAGDLTSRDFLAQRQGLQVVAHVHLGVSDDVSQRELVDSAIMSLRGAEIEEVLIAVAAEHLGAARAIAAGMRGFPHAVRLLLDADLSDILYRPRQGLGSRIVVEMQRPPLSSAERFVKRAIDVGAAAVLLALLSPALASVAAARRLAGQKPVFVTEQRRGFDGQPIAILRIRADGDHLLDRALRVSRLHRLPELFQVLRGEMSLVGPRPLPAAAEDRARADARRHARRHHLKPGVTGWAQVHRVGGDGQSSALHDLWYVDNWSPSLDLRILVRTALLAFDLKEVASAHGAAHA